MLLEGAIANRCATVTCPKPLSITQEDLYCQILKQNWICGCDILKIITKMLNKPKMQIMWDHFKDSYLGKENSVS